MHRTPIENARQTFGLAPVSFVESWNEKNLEIALWRLPATQANKVTATNHYASFVINGIDRYALIDERGRELHRGPVAAGRFRVVQGPARFETHVCSRAPVDMLNIFFSDRLMRQIAGEMGSRPGPIMLRDPRWQEQDALLTALASSIARDVQSSWPADRLFAQESAMLALNRLLVKYAERREVRGNGGIPDHRDYRWVLEFMTDNIDKPIGVDQLAAVVGMSTFQFIRGFNKVYGVTPMRYLRQMRLERAKKMLSETSLSVATVSRRLGFSEPSHFINSFRRQLGVTPRAYRMAETQGAK